VRQRVANRHAERGGASYQIKKKRAKKFLKRSTKKIPLTPLRQFDINTTRGKKAPGKNGGEFHLNSYLVEGRAN